ncbi:orotate phosphoribosyltransferase [bacterium]|nr:orotate phosphoribosyltransferase [bacterium]
MYDLKNMEQWLNTDISNIRDRLAGILKEKSLLLAPPGQPFTLASGQTSTYYINGKKTSCDPQGLLCISRLIWERIQDKPVQAIGGPTLGADPIVSGVSLFSQLMGKPIPLFLVRKEAKGHGTQKWIEGPDIEGMNVVMVEDVITTGGSLLKSIHAVRELNGKIIDLISIVDREQGGREAFAAENLPYSPIFSISELLPNR